MARVRRDLLEPVVRRPLWHGPRRGFGMGQPRGGGGLNPWDKDRIGGYNRQHGFDTALDALREMGLNQKQYSNLQAGRLPGHMHGAFLGMSADQLKQVAGYVNAQGEAQGTGEFDPISGAENTSMHFSYDDPRLAHGQTDEYGADNPFEFNMPWQQRGGQGPMFPGMPNGWHPGGGTRPAPGGRPTMPGPGGRPIMPGGRPPGPPIQFLPGHGGRPILGGMLGIPNRGGRRPPTPGSRFLGGPR